LNSRRLSTRRRPAKAAKITMSMYDVLAVNVLMFGLNPLTLVEKFSVESSTAKITGTDMAENHKDQRFIMNTPAAEARARHPWT